jgi:hypothetical protein
MCKKLKEASLRAKRKLLQPVSSRLQEQKYRVKIALQIFCGASGVKFSECGVKSYGCGVTPALF